MYILKDTYTYRIRNRVPPPLPIALLNAELKNIHFCKYINAAKFYGSNKGIKFIILFSVLFGKMGFLVSSTFKCTDDIK